MTYPSHLPPAQDTKGAAPGSGPVPASPPPSIRSVIGANLDAVPVANATERTAPTWEARALAAEARLAAVEALCAEARAGLSIPPIDCTNSCSDGPCDCSGVFRVRAWDLDPEAVRRAIAEAQP